MGEYKPPFTITNEILSYVSSISEKIGRITAISSLETKPYLRKNNRIKSIHSSLATVARIPITYRTPLKKSLFCIKQYNIKCFYLF